MSTADNPTLLLVEDDAIVAMNEASMLERHGFRVVTAGTSTQALEAVRSQKIDLVLMDIELGRNSASGAETAERILREREIPIVFLTGYAERETVERVKDITRYGYVLKSAGEFVLLEAIEVGFSLFRANLLLRESERESRAVVDNIDDAVLRYDQDGKFIFFSRGAERMFGFTAEEVIGKRGTETINPPVDSGGRDQNKMLADIFNAPEAYAYNENENVRKDGTTLLVAWHNKAVNDDHGNVLFMQCIGRDITERVRLERQKDFLLRELNHRIKNNLALITSIINLKEESLGARGDLADIRSQIEAVRIVHEKLHQSEDTGRINFREYIEEFLQTVFGTLAAGTVDLHIDMDAISVKSDEAISLGLIINEVATNAIKHGFRSDEAAHFTVELEQDATSDESVLALSNTGNPFPHDIGLDHPDTLGLRIIVELITQLGGTVELLRFPRTTFKITFPRTLGI